MPLTVFPQAHGTKRIQIDTTFSHLFFSTGENEKACLASHRFTPNEKEP